MTTTLLISAGTVLGIGALVFGTAVVIGLNVPGAPAHLDVLIIAAMLVQSVGTLIALAFVLRRRGHRISAIGFSCPSWRLLHLLWQIPTAVIVVLSVQLLVFAVTGSEPVSDSSTDSIARSAGPVAAILMFSAVAIITPFWEELFFRGVIYGYVRDRLGATGAITISAVVFALCHGVPILLALFACTGPLPRAAAGIPRESMGAAGAAHSDQFDCIIRPPAGRLRVKSLLWDTASHGR